MSTVNLQGSPIREYAVIVDPRDNVAVVKNDTSPGLELELPNGRTVTVDAAVTAGHRFATGDIPAGQFVLQFGQPIGTSLGIRQGDHISLANMSNDVPVV